MTRRTPRSAGGGKGDGAAQDDRRAAARWPVVARVGDGVVVLEVHRDRLTPDEARELAGRLLACADRAEG